MYWRVITIKYCKVVTISFEGHKYLESIMKTNPVIVKFPVIRRKIGWGIKLKCGLFWFQATTLKDLSGSPSRYWMVILNEEYWIGMLLLMLLIQWLIPKWQQQSWMTWPTSIDRMQEVVFNLPLSSGSQNFKNIFNSPSTNQNNNSFLIARKISSFFPRKKILCRKNKCSFASFFWWMPSRLAKCEINNRYVSFLHIGTSNSVRMFIKAFIDAELVIVWERFWADWCASMRVSCSFCVTNSIINSRLNGSDAIFFQMIIGSCHLCAFDIKEVFKK